MSHGLVMEAEATPWGVGDGEAGLPLENKVANQAWDLEGGCRWANRRTWAGGQWGNGHPDPVRGCSCVIVRHLWAFWPAATPSCPGPRPGKPSLTDSSFCCLEKEAACRPSPVPGLFLPPLVSYDRLRAASVTLILHWPPSDWMLKNLTVTVGYILLIWTSTVQ